MPPPDTAEGQSRRNAHHRQVNGQAGPFGDALIEHIGEIGSVRHDEGAVQNSQILLGLAVHQIPVSGKGVNGAGILHQGEGGGNQQYTAHGTAQNRLKGHAAEEAQAQAIPAGNAHADKIDDEEHRLPCKEKVVVEQVQCRPEGKPAAFAVQHRVVQGSQHIRKERRGIQKEKEEDVIQVEAAEGIQHPTDDTPFLAAHPAAHPQIGTAPGHRKFQTEHGHHGERHPPGRDEHGQPEKGGPQAIIGVGIDKPAAQVGGPAETAALLDEIVGIGVERDHLVVEIARIMKETAGDSIDNTMRNKQHGRQRQAKPEHLPVTGAARTQRQQRHGKTLLWTEKTVFQHRGMWYTEFIVSERIFER